MSELKENKNQDETCLNDEQLEKEYKKLIYKFHPIFILHSQEQYYPCSVDYYLFNSELYFEDTKLIDKGQVTQAIISNDALLEDLKTKAQKNEKKNKTNGKVKGYKYNLRLCEYAREGFLPSLVNNLAPLYARIKEYTCPKSKKPYLDITYIAQFAYNASYTQCGKPIGGDHDCDWEHITLRVCKTTQELRFVWFGAHGYKDGVWKKAEDCQYVVDGISLIDQIKNVKEINNQVNNNLDNITSEKYVFDNICTPNVGAFVKRLKVYVAKGSHALYPAPSTFYRICGCANDHTNDEHLIVWNPKCVELLQPPTNPSFPLWTQYKGYWHIDGIANPPNQEWWIEEPATSNKMLRRCFTSFLPSFKCCQPEFWCLKKEQF